MYMNCLVDGLMHIVHKQIYLPARPEYILALHSLLPTTYDPRKDRIGSINTCCTVAIHLVLGDDTWRCVLVMQDTTPCPSSPALVTPSLLVLLALFLDKLAAAMGILFP